MGYTIMGHTSVQLKTSKLLTGLTCIALKKETYKYAQKQNLEVQEIFV